MESSMEFSTEKWKQRGFQHRLCQFSKR